MFALSVGNGLIRRQVYGQVACVFASDGAMTRVIVNSQTIYKATGVPNGIVSLASIRKARISTVKVSGQMCGRGRGVRYCSLGGGLDSEPASLAVDIQCGLLFRQPRPWSDLASCEYRMNNVQNCPSKSGSWNAERAFWNIGWHSKCVNVLPIKVQKTN